MSKRKDKIAGMVDRIQQIMDAAKAYEKAHEAVLHEVHPAFVESARNLLHYRAMRSRDMRDLQVELGYMGLSRLAKAESHVMASLLTNKAVLKGFLSEGKRKIPKAPLSIKKSHRLLNEHTISLLGYRSRGRRTRIMVTLPTEAAHNYELVHGMVSQGMNIARINCAHDGPEIWQQMIDHVRTAGKRLQRNCKVAMDLGGPKIRTGSMEPGPQVMKITPQRDIRGQVIQPAKVWLGEIPLHENDFPHLPVSEVQDLETWEGGQALYFKDTRGKLRTLQLTEMEDGGWWAYGFDSAYLEKGIPFFSDASLEHYRGQIGDLPPLEQRILLNPGDVLRLDKASIPGSPAQYDLEGHMTAEAHISCTAPEIFDWVKEGEPVLFDDGKISGVIETCLPEEIRIRITHAKAGGAKLRADKGINFPESRLKIRGLTEKDKQDLQFVAHQADIVNMSFVNSAQDVADLLEELENIRSERELGVILKIETQQGFNNLTEILLAAMQTHPLGVMIARGDLAIEVGWENIGRIQEEILSLCQAAHIPDIWATQVLENLAKKGIPSRAEITDAAMAQRAECVMLNKGPQILRAISLLDTILKEMMAYQQKNAPMLPPLARAGAKNQA